MYDNQYPNDYNNAADRQNTANNTNYGQGSSNTYQYGGNGSFSGASSRFYSDGNPSGYGKKPEKPHKKTSGVGKKLLIGLSCGLVFGIFAGIGFQAMDLVSGYVKARAGVYQTREEEKQQAQESSQLSDVESKVEINGDKVVHTTVTDVTEVVKDAMPSVVSVNSKFVERMSFWGQQYDREGIGSGSGIIIGKNDTELLLTTNHHVVNDAEELTVQFVNGEQARAQIKGTDADKDLAVIAVQLEDISDETMSQIAIAQMGSSEELSVGEPVIAIGNALGYGQSVTTGVVSALDRAIMETAVQSDYQSEDTEINTFIQTDAAINQGNSGGALLNMYGQVVGIISNKIGGSYVEGMGYAIPISDVQSIIEELMNRETKTQVNEADRGYLGITGMDVVAEYSQLYGAPQGAFVSSVTEGSAADQAGLVRGDIITALNGVEITSMAELKEELQYYAAGTTVELTIMQGSPTGYQAKNVEVTLGNAQISIQ